MSKILHGEVSSLGPLELWRGTQRRLLTIKSGDGRIGAYLVSEDATCGVIQLGQEIELECEQRPSGERIIRSLHYVSSDGA